MLKLKRSKSQIIDNNTILNSLNEFAPKTRESIKPIESLNGNAYYPRRSRSSFPLSKLGYKPYIGYDQNLTFENTIDQIFEGLDQADIDEIKNHTKWNQNVSNVGLPKEKCLKNLQILAAIITKKKANSPESTKAIQEGVMSNVQDFLNDSGCYANLIARLESYRITDLQSLVMSNALYQYMLASGGLLTHFHDYPVSSYAKYPLKKYPINSRANNNITVFERDHRDEPNHDVRYFDEYIEFMHKSMKSAASGVTSEEMKDFILKNLATKLGYQDVQYYKSLEPDSDIKDLVEQYDKDLAKYHKSFNEVFEPKISDDSENDKDILGLIKDAIKKFERNESSFLKRQNLMNKEKRSQAEEIILKMLNIRSEPLIQNFLSKDYLSGFVNDNLAPNKKNELNANIEKLNLKAIIFEYSQYKISKTIPEIALICKNSSKEDLADKAKKYIKYRDEFPEKQRKEKEEVLKNLAENGYLDDISNDQEKENELTNYIPSKKLLNCVLNPNQSSKHDINDYVDAFIPTLHLFDKKSRDQQEENNTLLNNVNFQPPERRIGDRKIFIAFVSLILLFIGLMVLLFSPLAAYIFFGLGAICLAGAAFIKVKTFLKNRSNNKCNSLSKDACDGLKNQIKEKLKSVKNVARLVKNEEGWNEFIEPSLELKDKIREIERLYNINIGDLYNENIKSIRQSLINRFVINDMVEHRMLHPIQPNNKVPLDNLDPSVNDVNEDRNLDSTLKDGLVQKYDKPFISQADQNQISEEPCSHDGESDDLIYKDVDSENQNNQVHDQSQNHQKDDDIEQDEQDLTIMLDNIEIENYEKENKKQEKLSDNSSPNSIEGVNDKLVALCNKTPALYKKLANNRPFPVKVQNYINNEYLTSSMDQGLTRKNQKTRILSKKQRSLIQNYGNQKDSPRTKYRDLMNLNGNKSEVKTLNDLRTFQGKVKKKSTPLS
jgi:hypothetical protein